MSRIISRAESSIEQSVVTRAAQYGIPSIKLSIGEGWPDRVFLLPGGRVFFIEFKRPGQKPTSLQLRRQSILRQLGFQVEVHDAADVVFRAILAMVATP